MRIFPVNLSFCLVSLARRSVAFLIAVCIGLPPSSVQAHGLPDFTVLVEQNRESVVSISSSSIVREQQFPFPFPFLDPRLMPQLPPRERRRSGFGSGFILSEDGYILTNEHVVRGATELKIELFDGSEYEAEVIGSDELTDIALIKIEPESKLRPAIIGTAENLKVGEWVIAIGSPLRLKNTVTAGIVSAIERDASSVYVPFIQTDAAVNPGNSGGPLLNLKGEVIGINSQIISPTGSFAGYSLAIPIDLAIEIQQKLRSGPVKRGLLGVKFGILTDEQRDVMQLPGIYEGGALVSEVVPGSGADKAGVEIGDVIISYNGTPIKDMPDLPRQVAATKPGSTASFQVWRNGEVIKLQAQIGELGEETAAAEEEEASELASETLGMVLRDLSEEERQKFETAVGAILEGFVPGSSTPDELVAKIPPGSLIYRIVFEGRTIGFRDAAQLSGFLKKIKGGKIGFWIKASPEQNLILVTADLDAKSDDEDESQLDDQQ